MGGGRWFRGVESTFFIGRGGWKEGEMKKDPATADKNTVARQDFSRLFLSKSPNSGNTVRKSHSAFLKKEK